MARCWFVLLLVCCCLVAPSSALAAAPPYVLPGVFPGGNAPTAGFVNDFGQIDQMNPWQGKRNAVINVFAGDASTALSQMMIVWDQYRAIPMVSYQPQGNNSGRAAGAFDATDTLPLAAAFNRFAAGPDGALGNGDDRRAYLRYAWEPNVDNKAYSPCGLYKGQASHYIDAWRHAHDVFRNTVGIPATRVAWVYSVAAVVNPGDESCYQGRIETTYPGDAYVDWVGFQIYQRGCNPAWTTAAANTAARLRAVSNRPLGIHEAGATSVNYGISGKSSWINSYWNFIFNNDIRMAVWFNVDKSLGNTDCNSFEKPWEVFGGNFGDETYVGSNGRVFKAFSAYRNGIANSLVRSVDTSDPRLLDNARFLGL